MQHIDMEKFANGAFTEQINRELKKVTENIQDPNTDATAKRRNCNCYFDCAVFRYQMGSEKWNQRSLQCHHWKENG